jgi:hypothetical protein
VPLVVGVAWAAVRVRAVGVVGRTLVRGAILTGALNRATGAERAIATLRVGVLAATVTAAVDRVAALRGLSAGSAGTWATPTTAGCDLGAGRTTTLALMAPLWPDARPPAALAGERCELPLSAHAAANNAAQTIPVATTVPRPHDVRPIVCIKTPRFSCALPVIIPRRTWARKILRHFLGMCR